LWHLDLTLLPTDGGFRVPWPPFCLPQCWPFCFHLAVILDHFSRSVVAWKLFYRAPSAEAICELLDAACDAAGRAPKYIVSDQGPQLQTAVGSRAGAVATGSGE
jgi:transposase InsO family protein